MAIIYFSLIILEYIKDYTLVLLGKADSFDWSRISFFILPGNLISILIAPLTFLIYKRYKKIGVRRIWARLLLWSIVLGLLYGLLYHTFLLVHSLIFEPQEKELGLFELLTRYYKFTITSSFSGIVNFWALTILFFALDFYDQYKSQSYRTIQLQAQLTDSKLNNLRMQLNPHFLFNTLNTISMMIRKNKNVEAINMISGVSDLLRSSLNISKNQFITLEEEIELLKKYLEIEEQRFSDRLRVEFEIDEEYLNLKIPNLILQPLVENAFKYGVTNNINDAYIKISGLVCDEQFCIKIYNKGNILKEPLKEGIGLKNTRSRLAMSYTVYHFSLNNTDDLSGVVATIKIPLVYD